MSQQKANLTTLGQIQGDTLSAYLSAPIIAAPNTTILGLSGSARQIKDPSQTLRPAIGIERIHTKSIKLVVDEKGPAGEIVWALENGDDRIRFVGEWSSFSTTTGNFLNVPASTGHYMEVTFYGTGLNILSTTNVARDYRVSVDGGAEGANIASVLMSAVLTTRNYAPNPILPVVSGLTLGVHTVKIRVATTATIPIMGIEILNESSAINLPKGEVVSAGRKEAIASATTLAYNSGFDGSPTLNGRGGRVVEYIKSGTIGKVIQQVNASQANYPSADHSNEEVIQKINFREFGANRADDMGTVSANSTRGFTLDDGTTSLYGAGVAVQTPSTLGEGLALSGAASYITLTFVGTGLDVVVLSNNTEVVMTGLHSIIIDGITVATGVTGVPNRGQIQKIVSGLPYGTHTVKFLVTSTAFNYIISDFIIYGPKKPAIPSGATEIGEYYLMATYSATAVTGTGITNNNEMPVGVLSKAPTREIFYNGAGWNVVAIGNFDFPHAFNVQSSAADNYSYTFWGTGINMHLFCSSSGVYTVSATIDGVANATGTNLVNMSNGGGGSYSTTSTTNGAPARFAITGLTLGLHTIKLTRTAGTTWGAVAQNVITPVHYPMSKRGSLAMKPAAEFAKQTELGGIDLSKAKAWMVYDSSATNIVASYNVSAVIKNTTGQFIVFFERPFKTANYAVMATGAAYGVGADQHTVAVLFNNQTVTGFGTRPGSCAIATRNTDGSFFDSNRFAIACFGELETDSDGE